LSTPRRRPLTRDRVLRAALRLVDKKGLDELSMRKLAQELGVEAMSLYNHVADKDDLLDGLVELIGGEIDLAQDAPDWKTGIRRRVVSLYQVFSRHPWAAGLWMKGRSLGVARPRFADAVLAGLRDGGFSEDLIYHGFHVIQGHVLGFTLQEQNLDFDAKKLERMAVRFLREFPAQEYPDLAEHVRQHLKPRTSHQGAFEFGLDLILDGLERSRAGGRLGSAAGRRRAVRPRAGPRR
jgi:AcrR family transcriptional regulator